MRAHNFLPFGFLLLIAACGSEAVQEDGVAIEKELESRPSETFTENVVSETSENEGDEEDTSGQGADEAASRVTQSVASSPAVQSEHVAAVTQAQTEPVTMPSAFRNCAVCHSFEEAAHGIGPSLAGVIGRRAGSAEGANYSAAMLNADLRWNAVNLDRFLAGPGSVVPGSSMPNPNIGAADRAAIISFLESADGR